MIRKFAHQTLPAISTLVLLCGAGCQKTTEQDEPAAEPFYTWWGTVVDSLTGEGVDGLLVDVREREEHIRNGWDPYLTPGIVSSGHFQAVYYLRGVVPCSSFPDTTLTLHLDFVDPLGRYAAKTHQSDSFVVCPRVLPPIDQLPLNLVRNLRIALARQ